MFRSRSPHSTILWIACLVLLASIPALGQSYSVYDLGTLGGAESFGYDINNSNEAVGGSQIINPGSGPLYLKRGFLWKGWTMTDLGTLPGGEEARTFAINSQGWSAGWAQDSNGVTQPVFQPNGSWIQIPQPGLAGEARGINDQGRVVGYYVDKSFDTRAFAWSTFDTLVDLSLVDNAGASLANAIGPDNLTVGWSRIGPDPCGIFSASKPTIWERDSAGDWTATGLPYSGCAGNVYGLNEYRFLVGEVRASGFNTTPTLWVWRGAWYESPLDLDGHSSGAAYDINKNSQIVGTAGIRAYLWDGGTAIDLNTEIPAGSGWVLESAKAINDCGWITGYGRINGDRHAFVLVPRFSSGCC